MNPKYHFWTHGADVIAEYTKEYTGHDNGLYMRRAGWGAQIKQKKGTSNWFHFAIPTAEMLDNKPVEIIRAWLRVRNNEDALIDRVQIREASGPMSGSPIIYDTGPYLVYAQDTELIFDIYDHICKGPLVMCVHVEFEKDNGEVVFAGAGVWFNEVI